MQRYFIKNETIHEHTIHLNKEDYHHMTHVMRMRAKEKVSCVDEDGHVYLCSLPDPQVAQLEIEQEIMENHELDVYVRLIYGLPKLDKFEMVIQKCTELGVSEIVPFLSQRSLIRTDEKRFSKKMERLQKIVKEACEQSQRERLVKITEPMDLKAVLQLEADNKLVAYEEASKQGECQNFEACLNQLKPHRVLNIVVGPEGGLDQSEVEALVEHGYLACSLGTRILRSETAPLYMMSVIGFYCELKHKEEA